jgi:hypothetical protein
MQREFVTDSLHSEVMFSKSWLRTFSLLQEIFVQTAKLCDRRDMLLLLSRQVTRNVVT